MVTKPEEKIEELEWPEEAEVPAAAVKLAEDATLYAVPSAYLDEVLASELVQHLRNYHIHIVSRRAARHVGQNDRAEQSGKIIAYSRNAIALISHEHGNARKLAEEMMVLEAKRVQQNRVAALAEEPE